jgi:hypothetical protein
MTSIDITILILCIAFTVNGIFVFRFQYLTRSIARLMSPWPTTTIQVVITPVWIGLLGWLHSALIIVIPVIILIHFGWQLGTVAGIYCLFGFAPLSLMSPLPSIGFYYQLMTSELDSPRNAQSLDAITLREMIRAYLPGGILYTDSSE